MKNTAFFLILCTLCTLALADPAPVVEIVSPSQVNVDGQPVGSIVDALANGTQRAALLDAVIKWENVITTDAADKVNAAKALVANERQTIDDILGAALADELKTGDGPVAAKIRAIQASIAAARN